MLTIVREKKLKCFLLSHNYIKIIFIIYIYLYIYNLEMKIETGKTKAAVVRSPRLDHFLWTVFLDRMDSQGPSQCRGSRRWLGSGVPRAGPGERQEMGQCELLRRLYLNKCTCEHLGHHPHRQNQATHPCLLFFQISTAAPSQSFLPLALLTEMALLSFP